MDYLRAAILGIVQGLAEFLPISSSGHLILVPALFKWPDQGLAFDVGLHAGTLLALLAYFWRDWWRMGRAMLTDLLVQRTKVRTYSPDSQLLALIAFGSIPAAIVGLLFDSWIEENLRQPWLIAIALAVAGLIMLAADRRSAHTRTLESINFLDVTLIGLGQATALFPGVSRSGATITVGLFRNFTRDSAARFAFLLGTPAFVGAAVLKAGDVKDMTSHETNELFIGFICSAIVGFFVIHFLMRFLRTRSLVPFVAYRLVIAALTLVIGAIRVA